MGMNWRQLLLVVLVAAIVGGASGFVGDQVSARWFDESTLGSPGVIPSSPGFRNQPTQLFPSDEQRRNKFYEHKQYMKEYMDCLALYEGASSNRC